MFHFRVPMHILPENTVFSMMYLMRLLESHPIHMVENQRDLLKLPTDSSLLAYLSIMISFLGQ